MTSGSDSSIHFAGWSISLCFIFSYSQTAGCHNLIFQLIFSLRHSLIPNHTEAAVHNHLVGNQHCDLQSRTLGSWLGHAMLLSDPCTKISFPWKPGQVFIHIWTLTEWKWECILSSEILDPCFDAATLLGQWLAEMALILFEPSRHCHNIISSYSEGINKR